MVAVETSKEVPGRKLAKRIDRYARLRRRPAACADLQAGRLVAEQSKRQVACLCCHELEYG